MCPWQRKAKYLNKTTNAGSPGISWGSLLGLYYFSPHVFLRQPTLMLTHPWCKRWAAVVEGRCGQAVVSRGKLQAFPRFKPGETSLQQNSNFISWRICFRDDRSRLGWLIKRQLYLIPQIKKSAKWWGEISLYFHFRQNYEKGKK